MDIKSIQCNYCRQRISATLPNCPVCKLPIWNSANERSIKLDNSSSPVRANEKYSRMGRFQARFTGKLINGSSNSLSLNVEPSPLLSSSSSRQQKRAVLCGVTYNKSKNKLKGTINDVKNMREFLITRFGFRQEAIVMLTEEETEEQYIPIRKNIQRALLWLVDNCQSGDSLVFYFAGHGLRKLDLNGDELDGFDETICPLDFLTEGMILDDDINSTIVRPLKKGVTLHVIVDACHSGTILDLVHHYNSEEKKWDDNKPPSGAPKATSGGLAICISACEDNQMAYDTSAFTRKTTNGAMTYILIQMVKEHPGISYGDLLDLMDTAIKEVNNTGSFRVLRRIFSNRLSQNPQLSSSETFDVYKKQFTL